MSTGTGTEIDTAAERRFEAIGLTTAAEALAKWDAGELIWSVEMGGLGPGYEQIIQMMAFEFIRALLADPVAIPWEDTAGLRLCWGRIEQQVDPLIAPLGCTGAQYGAAKSLAAMVVRHGYARALAYLSVKDRLMMVSKSFPGAPPLAARPDAAMHPTADLADGYRPISLEEDSHDEDDGPT